MDRAVPRHQRLYWTLRLWGPAWLDRLWMLAATGLALYAIASLQSQQDRLREGREIAIKVLCGAQQGVIAAGRHELLLADARQEVTVYSRIVASAVEREAGVRGLVAPDGQLRCGRLLGAAHADKP